MPDSQQSAPGGSPWTDRAAQFVTRRASALATLGILIGVATAVPLKDAWVDTSLAKYIDEASPGYAALKEHEERFDLSDPVLIVLRDKGSVFDVDRAQRLVELHRQLEEVTGVVEVWSLANGGYVDDGGEGIEIAPLLEGPPFEAEALSAAKERVASRSLYRDLFVSDDLRDAYLMVFLGRDDDPQRETRAMHGIYQVFESYAGTERVIFSGLPFHLVAISDTALSDVFRLVPLTVLVLFVLLTAVYRSVWAAILPLGAVGVVTAAVIGTYVAAGKPLTEITSILPVLFVAIGVAYSMHLLNRYARLEGSPVERTVGALREVLGPITISAVTTMVGFGALVVSDVPAVRHFGLFGAIGVGCVYVSISFFLPALLCLVGPTLQPRQGTGGATDRILGTSESLATHRPMLVTAAMVGLSFVVFLGASRIEVDNAFVNWLRPSHPARSGFDELSGQGHGTIPIYFQIDTEREGGALDPAVLRQVRAFGEEVRALPEVTSTLSLATLIEEMHYVGSPEAEEPLPSSRELIAQYLLLSTDGELGSQTRRFVDFDRRTLNVFVQTTLAGSKGYDHLLGQIEAIAGETLAGVDVEVVGTMSVIFESTDAIVDGQIRSLTLALLAIGLAIMVALRSVRFALIAFPSNVLPIAVLFGVMGALGIKLDMLSSITACLTLGIIVDDSIHFVVSYRRALARGLDPDRALEETFDVAGPPIVYTTIALAGGFTMLMLSGFAGIFNAGLLVTVALFAALLADILLLPVLLRRFGAIASCLTQPSPGGVPDATSGVTPPPSN